MFFKRLFRSTPIPAPTTSFVHQLSKEELERCSIIDINPDGAGFNINLIKKEDTLMVEKLKAYRAELEAKKAEVEASVIDVEAEVAAYRESLIAQAEAARKETVAKLASDIDCINGIIAREEAVANTPAETVVE